MGILAVANRSLKSIPVAVILFFSMFVGSVLTILYIGVELFIFDNDRMSFTDYTGRQYLIGLCASLFDFGAMSSLTLAY